MCGTLLGVPPELIRVRDKVGTKAGKVLYPYQPLSALGRIYDGKDFAIQKMQDRPTYPADNEMIVEVQMWKPSSWEFGPRSEIFVSADITVSAFRWLLASMSGIPIEDLKIAKPRRYHLKDVQQIPLLLWEIEDSLPLQEPPLYVQNG